MRLGVYIYLKGFHEQTAPWLVPARDGRLFHNFENRRSSEVLVMIVAGAGTTNMSSYLEY